MSKFLHDDADDNDDRAMTIPRRFSSKTAELKMKGSVHLTSWNEFTVEDQKPLC